MSENNKDKSVICSFCSKSEDEVYKIIYGYNGYICNECIETCVKIIENDFEKDFNNGKMLKKQLDKKNGAAGINDLESVIAEERLSEYFTKYLSATYEEDDEEDEVEEFELMKPKEIKAKLDEYIIGQEEAKVAISVAAYNHYKKNFNREMGNEDNDIELQKSNILLIGPTGSGKTLIAQTMARILDVPFAIADATTLTEAGYVGEDVENILVKLVQAADYNIERAEKGIIFIDEIDKIARKSESVSITRDVSGEGVQQSILKILEGTVSAIPPQGGRKHPHQEFMYIDTTNILFICGGSFAGIETYIDKRLNKKTIGFGLTEDAKEELHNESLKNVTTKDFQKYGLIPELIGRLPVVVALDTVTEDALVNILTKPKNAITKQYEYLLALDGIELVFDEPAIRSIAKKALKQETGVRGLRSIIESFMQNVMFEIPSMDNVEKVLITEKVIEDNEEPEIIYKKDKK